MKSEACAECKLPYGKRACRDPQGTCPANCTTAEHTDTVEKAKREYEKEEIRFFASEAAKQERAGYKIENGLRSPIKPRITEVVEFCKRMGYKRLGLAFCGGLREEATTVEQILCDHGFEVKSVICKFGGVDKSFLGLTDEDKLCGGGHESMCNPIAQAMLLNEEKTEFNILLGLCVGHDSLFLKYSEAMCTVLAVKDRLLGHNPLACIYTNYGFYHYLSQKTR